MRRRGPLLRELIRGGRPPGLPRPTAVVGARARTLLGREVTRTITGVLRGELLGARRRTRRVARPLLPGNLTRLATGTGHGTRRVARSLLRELSGTRSGALWTELVGARTGSGVARPLLRRETTRAGQQALSREFVGTGMRRREVSRAPARRLTRPLLPGKFTRLTTGTGHGTRRLARPLLRELAGTRSGALRTERVAARSWLARTLLRREVPRAPARRLIRSLLPGDLPRLTTGTDHGTWRLTRPQRVTGLTTCRLARSWLQRELPRLTGSRIGRLTGPLRRNPRTTCGPGPRRDLAGLPRQLHARNTRMLRTVGPLAVRRARLIRRTIVGPIPGRRLVGGPIAGLTRHRRTWPTRLVDTGIDGPIRPTLRRPRTRRGDVPLVLPAGHATLPRRDRGRAGRSVAAIVVVVPMSGIIVAHHASCTRRNPRIPPVR